MDQPEVHQYINYLHDRFVIVPVDKASNNFGIVCKSSRYTGGDSMFLYRFVRRRHRPQIFVHTITF